MSEKLNRKGVLMFAQSVVNLIKYWCMPDYQDDSFYSAVVNANGSYGINEDVYLSVPIKFENGTFFFIRNYKFSTQTRTAMNELIAVSGLNNNNLTIATLILFTLTTKKNRTRSRK